VKTEDQTPAQDPLKPPAAATPEDKSRQPDKVELSPTPVAAPLPSQMPPCAAAELSPTGPLASHGMHQGDVPMMRTWKTFGLQTLLAAALAAAPTAHLTAAEEKKATETGDTAKRLKALEDGMKKVQEDADSIRAEGLKIKTLKDKVDQLKKDMDKVQDRLTQLDETIRDAIDKSIRDALKPREDGKGAIGEPPPVFKDILSRLSRLEDMLKDLSGKLQVARYPAATGRVLLTNRYPEEMLFIVNGRSFRLAPGESRLLDNQRAGSLTYEVVSPTWGSRARKTTTLLASETLRLTVD
jgi:hypothetical protein